jgi:methionyl aminopeptidase
MPLVKSEKEIQLISESCKIVADVLKYIGDFVKPGATTKELDKIVEDYILSKGGEPAFKGYRVRNRKFPASICSSVNEVVVHGIPNDIKLETGDILSIDVGVKKNGYYGDSAFTFEVGEVSPEVKKLLKVTEEALYRGISQARDGNTVNDIGSAIQEFVEGSGFTIVRELVGHGIGKNLHEEPAVPNYYSPSGKTKLKKGMTIAIEPMVNYGRAGVYEMEDGWTVVTKDHKPSAHFEHTILITDGEPEILTKRN